MKPRAIDAGRSSADRPARPVDRAGGRERIATQRARRDNDRIGTFANQVKRAEFLCAGMIQQFGGAVRFVRNWMHQGRASFASRPGSKRALDFFGSVVHLIELCSYPGALQHLVSSPLPVAVVQRATLKRRYSSASEPIPMSAQLAGSGIGLGRSFEFDRPPPITLDETKVGGSGLVKSRIWLF